MAGNKKISQLVDGGAGQAGDNFVIERGGVNFKVDNSSISGNPGGLLLNGVVNDMIVKDEKAEVALEQRLTLLSPISFVDNTALPPTEVNDDIYLLDDTGASNAAWDGNPINTWVRFDGTAGLWKGIAPIDGMITTLQDTGLTRKFDPTTSTWVLFGVATPAGVDTEIQFNNAGAFGASSLFTFSTAFTEFKCDSNVVFNESGNARDFRIEGVTVTDLFFVDGSADAIGVGISSGLQAKFHIKPVSEIGLKVRGTTGTTIAQFQNDGATGETVTITSGGSAVSRALDVTGNPGGAIIARSSGVGKNPLRLETTGGGTGAHIVLSTLAGIGAESIVNVDGSIAFKARIVSRSVGLLINLETNNADAQGLLSTFDQTGQLEDGTQNMNVFKRVARNTFGYTGDHVRIEENFGSGSVSADNTGNLFHVVKDGSTVFVIESDGAVGSGGAPNASAQLEVTSTTKGFRLTPMTAAQAAAIATVEGLMVFVSDTDATFTTIGFWGFENGAWADL